MYRRILVPTDGSTLSGKAVAHAIGLAKSLGARITALYVAAPYPRPVYVDSVVDDPAARSEYASIAEREAQHVLGPVQRKAAVAKVTCDVVHTTGDAPWEAILDAARAHKSDVIVMASHGRRGVAALLLGSETQKVLTHARIPVVVVR